MIVLMLEIVKRRLKLLTPVDPHLDENLIAAFVEDALTSQLRSRVLRHLCACPACRALAAISRSEVISVMPPAVAVRWYWPRWTPLRWASLRWANALVATAVIGGAVWFTRVEVTTMFRPAEVHLQVAKAGTGNNANSETAFSLSRAQSTEGQRGSGSQRETKPSAPDRPAPEAGSRQPSSVIAFRGTSIESLGSVQPTTARPPLGDPKKISPSVAVGLMASTSLPSVAQNHTRWMVSGSGVLYQSFDDGVRWQSVTVRQNLRVRSVSFLEDDIWVGGNGGALFHSSDSGRHWTQVLASRDGQGLSDDIERVEFTDRNHGSVTTASGNIWVTADHGETWATQ